MKKKKVLEDLYDYCRWNDSENVKNLLNKFSDFIDVLDDRGIFLRLAISGDNLEMLRSLLTYFEEKQFPRKNTEYEEAKNKLIEILENATDSVDLSPEMKQVLSPYIDFEGSEHDTLNDSFLDMDPVTFFENKNEPGSDLLNEEVLRRFNTEQISQKQIIEDVLGFNSHDITENHEDSNVELQLALVGKLNETEAH